MMKIKAGVFFSLLSVVPAFPSGVGSAKKATTTTIPMAKSGLRADSELGQKLLSRARRVEQNDGGEDEAANNEEADMTWVSGFSLKFQGCHFVQQFKGGGGGGGDGDGEGGQGENGQVVETKSLVRFRLCPYDMCDDSKDGGCSYRYGDYIIGLESFVNVYFEHMRRMEEYECETYLQYYCNCDAENQGDDFNEEQCQYDCLVQAGNGMESVCMDNNPYKDDGAAEEGDSFNVEQYMECAEYELSQQNDQQDNAERRRLEDGAGDQGSGLYIGPYCAKQGGAIYLGMFADESCTSFADANRGADTFESIAGMELPFATTSIVSSKCVSCLNVGQEGEGDGNNNNNNGDNANNQVVEVCQEVYQLSGKCEENLPSDTLEEPNNNACTYINGIQTVRQDGIIGSSSTRSTTSTTFIVLLSLSTISLAFYVHYLRTKIARRELRVSDPKQPLYREEEMM